MLLTMNTVIKYLEKPNAQKVCLKIGTRVSLQSGPLLTVWCWLLHITHTITVWYWKKTQPLLSPYIQLKSCFQGLFFYYGLGVLTILLVLPFGNLNSNFTRPPFILCCNQFPWPRCMFPANAFFYSEIPVQIPKLRSLALYSIELHNTRMTCDTRLTFG